MRKRCCHTEALYAGYQVILFTRNVLVPNYRIIELVYFHTEHRGRSRGFVTNYRIVEFFFTRRIAESHGVLSRIIVFLSSHGESRRVSGFMSRIIELSNFSSHGASRMVTVLLSRDLSFGPTDQREVICELSNFSSHGESRKVSGFMSRIIESLFTRKITEVFFVTRHVLGHEFARLVLGPTDQREVIVEFLSSHGWLWRL